MDNEKYDVIIGLEIHIQTKTDSKMFCSCSAKYFGKEPNIFTCPVCLGLPGALPIPNKKALELCILMGLATNCHIAESIKFDRKHYFYPDLPKGYQISQYKDPVCSNGSVEIFDENNEKVKIEIERIHQEEDVAKSTHHTDPQSGEQYTLIDYNKSGVPLIEIVTKPTIRSAHQAKAYATKIRQLARYLNISDADMEKGQMRCEPNISVQLKNTWEYTDGKIIPKEGCTLNPKVEVKNIGSITAVEKSIEYEVERLIKDIEEGKKIIQQTRGWNADKGITEFQRSKETAEDYRYMPEPDIPVIEISEELVNEIKKSLVELPDEKLNKYMNEYGLSKYDAEVITANKDISSYFDSILEYINDNSYAKDISNWLTGPIFSIANENKIKISDENIPIKSVSILVKEFKAKNIVKSKAEEILKESINEHKDLEELINNAKRDAESSNNDIENIVDEVLNNNTQAVNDYKSGKQASIGFLIGQVMQKSKGLANPNVVKDILISKLNG